LKSEFKAVRNLLDEGFDNLAVTIPFIRDVLNIFLLNEIMIQVGITPHRDLEVGASIETPSAVLTLHEFIEVEIDFEA
jgi:pyruvate, water dikinase